MSGAPLTLGTAGHIDHGKTALTRALTGVDTDRLPQERARGISIELGYASLALPSGRRLSVVDVPGHERLVRAMVAGATGIDLFLMTVAADDGVMPQTREHAAVLEALGVDIGVVAVTKSDLADPEIALLEAAELLPGAEAVAVSARTGAGLDDLRAALERATARTASRSQRADPARLHVDRVFTIRGAGTVVTGTLWSGAIGRGDEIVLLPSGRRARVRATQIHEQAVERAAAGQRVAVNLVGLSVDDVQRGDVVAAVDSPLAATYLIDAELTFTGDEPEHGDRATVHHGTREAPARMAWLGGRFWQLRLERPLVPAAGDRVVIRQIAPPDTLGGGRVLDPHPRKHGPSRNLLARLNRLVRGEPASPVPAASGVAPGSGPGPGNGSSRPAPGSEAGSGAVSSGAPSPRAPEPPAPPPLSDRAQRLAGDLLVAGVQPPLSTELDPEDLAALRCAGIAVRVSKTLHYHRDVLADVRQRVLDLADRGDGSVTLAALRDELGTSRKFAQALLEHLDAERVTLRRGDAHVVRASARNRR